jgi:integrase
MSIEIKWRNGIAYIHGTIEGERIRRSLGTRDPKIATRKKAEEEARLQRASIYGIEYEATFAEACVHYLRNVTPKKNYLEPILKKIGKMKLAKIKPGTVKALAKEIYPRCKTQTWNRQVIVPISAVINYAHDNGMCAPIRIRRFKAQDERVRRAIDRTWIDRFMASATSPHLAAYALFLHTTAARPTEAIMLQPHDLDLERNYGISSVATKTGSRREFWLTEEMTEVLRRLPPRQIQWGQYRGEWRVFGWADLKGPIGPWKKTCKLAGIDYVTPYEAGRHSFATEAVTRQNKNVIMVAKTGNWKDTRTLLKHYAHPEDMAGFIEDTFGSKTAQRPDKHLKVVENKGKL